MKFWNPRQNIKNGLCQPIFYLSAKLWPFKKSIPKNRAQSHLTRISEGFAYMPCMVKTPVMLAGQKRSEV